MPNEVALRHMRKVVHSPAADNPPRTPTTIEAMTVTSRRAGSMEIR
jgi:hypothetical protein